MIETMIQQLIYQTQILQHSTVQTKEVPDALFMVMSLSSQARDSADFSAEL